MVHQKRDGSEMIAAVLVGVAAIESVVESSYCDCHEREWVYLSMTLILLYDLFHECSSSERVVLPWVRM